MKKKILMSILCGIMIIGLTTGCGNNKQEFTENMQEMRSYTAGYINNKSLGEVLDIAIENAKWTEEEKYSLTSGAIIVKGTDKNTGEDIELIWLTTHDSTESGFEKMTKGGKEINYNDFLDYLKSYVESSNNSNNNNNENENNSNYEAENILNDVFNQIENEYKTAKSQNSSLVFQEYLTDKRISDKLAEKNCKLYSNTLKLLNTDIQTFVNDNKKVYLLLQDEEGAYYSFYANLENESVTITDFKLAQS